MSMSRRLAGLAAAAALLPAMVLDARAAGPPQPLKDWPCDTPFAGPLAPQMLWPGADRHPRPAGAWEANPVAHRLVDFLVAGENSPAMGRREIEDFVAKNGSFKLETSLLIVSGMVERGNKLRLILLEGIKEQIIKSHVLAAAVEENTAQLRAVETSAGDRQTQAKVTAARRQNLDMLGNAGDTAAQLCHRLVYDETKLKTLAAALRAHTE